MSTQQSSPEPIAIIGSGCRFPGEASSPHKLWALINEPRDVSSVITPDRFNVDGFFHKDNSHGGTSNIKHSYLLQEDYRKFDASFFSVKPIEAEAMDPQQRLLLEVVYEALEAGGQKIHRMQGSDTAVYVGAMSADYGDIGMRDLDSIPTYFSTGSHRSILSNRISWFYDWRGPCMTIDTACSSSLVALDSAVQALRNQTSRVAVAAGTNLCLGPEQYVAESKLKMLSPSGRSAMWSADADGYARGEGVAAVVLKTLSAALEDGDQIECIIRATGVNQDGKTKGITVPSRVAQAALIHKTYASIGLNPNDPLQRCQYFEAHGTGTPAGDPIEAGAIAKAFFGAASKNRKDILYVGSIKTIIGHTEGTAGLAGVIKASLALKHKVIPPNLHFNSLSDTVKPFYKNLRIVKASEPWPAVAPGQPRRASVNSFGFGGTNSHAILESYDEQTSTNSEIVAPFVFSAVSQQSLKQQLTQFSAYLDAYPEVNMRDLWYTLNRRSVFSVRSAFTASSVVELQSKLRKVNDNTEEFQKQITSGATPKSARILGVFTGQGAQWATMGRELVQKSTFAAQRLDELIEVLASLPSSDRPSWTLKEALFAEGAASKVNAATVSQPLCTAVQIILVDLLKTIGIKFDSVVGHSSGEIGAAYAAGLLTATDAIRIAYYRGLYAHLAAGSDGKKGVMMAIGTSFEDAQELCALEAFEGKVTVAASNSSSSQTLSGDVEAMEHVKEVMEEEGKFARLLKVEVAYHSHHMIPCGDVYLQALNRCKVQPQQPSHNSPCWFSSVSGGGAMDESSVELSGKYWKDNMLNAVLFDQALRAALNERGPFDLALEVGPHPALQGPASQTVQEISGESIPYSGVLRRGKSDLGSFSDALGYIWEHLGDRAVDLEAFDALFANGSKPQIIKGLPSYAWDHERAFWHESRQSIAFRTRHERSHELLGARTVDNEESEVRWRNYIGPKTVPWIPGHRLQGQVVFPAAGYIAMTSEAALKLYPEDTITRIAISNMVIGRPMTFDDDSVKVEILYSLSNIKAVDNLVTASWRCSAALKKGSAALSTLAHGELEVELGQPSDNILPAQDTCIPALTDVDPDTFYGDLSQLGYNYNGVFKGMTGTKRKLGLSMGAIVNPVDESLDQEDVLIVHPGLVDIGFQAIFMAHSAPKDGGLYALHVPNLIHKITINPALCRQHSNKAADLPFRATAYDSATTGIEGDVAIYSTNAEHAMVQIEGCRVVPFSIAKASDDRLLFSKFEWGPLFPRVEASEVQATNASFQKATDYDNVARSHLLELQKLNLKSLPLGSEQYSHLLEMTRDAAVTRLSGKSVMQHVDYVKSVTGNPELDMINEVGRKMFNVFLDGETIALDQPKQAAYLNTTIGESPQHSSLIQLLEQIAFLFPHLNILEIGNGSTYTASKAISNLGTAFRSYTYTMSDAEALKQVQGQFSGVSRKTVFKTLDLAEDLESQEFTEASYDMVISIGGLSLCKDSEKAVTNMRKLLKTGGYILLLEPTNKESIRTWLVMNVIGNGPVECTSAERWTQILSKDGFGNVEGTGSNDGSTVHPYTLFSARATSSDFAVLQQPLAYDIALANLVIVGESSSAVQKTMKDLRTILQPYCQTLTMIDNVEEFTSAGIAPMSSVIVLTDLGEPIFRNMSESKLSNLKALFDMSRNVLWASKGCWVDSPYANMMLGLGRTVRVEMPHLRLQFLDLEFDSLIDSNLLAETFLRLTISGLLEQKGQLETALWYNEPELVVREGEVCVPRVVLDHEKNNRYNSSRRPITRTIDPRQSCVSAIVENSNIQIHSDRLDARPSSRTIQVKQSTLHAIKTPIGYAHIIAGIDVTTGQKVMAVSSKNSSIVNVPFDWSTIVKHKKSSRVVLANAIGVMLCYELSRFTDRPVLIYEPPAYLLAAVISDATLSSNIQFIGRQSASSSVTSIHAFEPRRSIRSKIASNIGLFIDCAEDNLSATIRDCLPASCIHQKLSSYFGKAAPALAGDLTELLAYIASLPGLGSSAELSVIDMGSGDLGDLDPKHDSLVQWPSNSISTSVKRATESIVFPANATYLLFGLSGELGKSVSYWMAERGARHFVLTSRNPAQDEVWKAQMKSAGAQVRVVSNDITNKAAVQELVRDVQNTMPPVRGLVNGVMAITDKPFVNVDYEDMYAGMKGKVQGTITLNELFSENSLDFYVSLCSLANAVGNSGQTVYSAANNFMAATMAQRRQRGLAGSTLDIGPLLGIGYLSRLSLDQVQEHLYKSGFMFCSERDFHNMFAEAVTASPANSGLNHEILTGIRILSTDESIKGPWFFDPRMQHFVRQPEGADISAGGVKAKASVQAQLASAKNSEQVAAIVQDAILAQLQNMLKLSVGGVDDQLSVLEKTADELGIDSLVAVELRSWFLGELLVDIPVLKILGGASMKELMITAIENLPAELITSSGEAIEEAIAEVSVKETVTEIRANVLQRTMSDPATEANVLPAIRKEIFSSLNAPNRPKPSIMGLSSDSVPMSPNTKPVYAGYHVPGPSADYLSRPPIPARNTTRTKSSISSSGSDGADDSLGSSPAKTPYETPATPPSDLGIEEGFFDKAEVIATLASLQASPARNFSRVNAVDSSASKVSQQKAVLTKTISSSIPSATNSATSLSAVPARKQMSFGQARFWFSDKFLQDKAASNVSVLYNVKGNLNIDILAKAVAMLGQRHEALRTRFLEDEKYMPIQEILPHGKLSLEVVAVNSEEDAREELQKSEKYIYDLDSGLPIRVMLLKMNATSSFLLVGYHHIAMDGMSLQIFLTELSKAYSGMTLPTAVKQYQVFSERQRSRVEKNELGQAMSYWRKEFATLPTALKLLPGSKLTDRKPLLQYEIERVHESVEPDVNARVKKAARSASVSPFHFYLSVFKAMLSKISNADDICVGISDANRLDGDSANTIGMFLNTLPIRLSASGDESFSKLVKDTKKKVYSAMEHSSIPFDILLRELSVPRSNTHSPLFQVLVDYRNEALAKQPFGNCYLDGVIGQGSKTACDIVLNIIDSPSGKTFFNFEMQKSLYGRDASEKIAKSFVQLVKQFAEDTSLPIGGVSLPDSGRNSPVRRKPVSAVERSQTVVAQFAQVTGEVQDSPWQPTVPQQIFNMASSRMHQTALEDGYGMRITYKGLVDRANAIANALLKRGVQSASRVACLQTPTCEWICTMLAVLQVGAVYVPLNSTHPLQRLQDIVHDCDAVIVVCDSETEALARKLDTKPLDTSTLKTSGGAPTMRARPDAPAVILYTSGSTGKPKGIMYKHSNWVEGLVWKCQFGPQTVLQQSALSFDMSIEQAITALCTGGHVYVASTAQRKDPAALAKIMSENKITFTVATPSEYLGWLTYGHNHMTNASSWTHAISGGEAFPQALLTSLKAHGITNLNLLNGYGPSEVTLGCTALTIPQSLVIDGSISAGNPFPNYAIYILDDRLQPVSFGVTGEIVVAGAGVANGYLQNPELTSSKFLPNPYASSEFLARGWNTMYRTGDRGYLGQDRQLYVLGRMDDDTQVKLRGMRFELGDVEAALVHASQGTFETVVVTSHGSPATFIAAHVVFAAAHRVTSKTARQELLDLALKQADLPQYMVPAHIAELDTLPLTTNGKIDRKAIAALPLTNNVQPETRDEELTDLENKLKDIWREVIPRELSDAHNITRDTDFFNVGGNSLLLVRIQALIRDRLDVAVPLVEMFEVSTLGKMAAKIAGGSVVTGINWEQETAMQDELLEVERLIKERANAPKSRVVRPSLPHQGKASKYRSIFGSSAANKSSLTLGNNEGIIVALTGATGFVGARILKELLADSRVIEVHCLAIRPTEEKRKRPIPASDKVFVNSGDLSQPLLGLSPRTAEYLKNRVDIVIHTGAKRAFWDNYEVIRDVNVASTKEVISMFAGRTGGRQPHIHYVSSSEDSLQDFDQKRPTDGAEGYIASKWACEQYLGNVSERLGLETTVHRFGVNRANNESPGPEELARAAPSNFIKSMAKHTLLTRHVPVADDWQATVRFMNADGLASSIVQSALSSYFHSAGSGSFATMTHTPDFTIDALTLRDQLYNKLGWKMKMMKMKEVNPMYWVGVLKYAGFEYVVCGQEIRMGELARGVDGLTENILMSRR